LQSRQSPNYWFKAWRRIIVEKKIITRIELSELSGCSLWTIKALQKDFCDSTININYRGGKFVFDHIPEPLAQTLSTLSTEDKEELK